MHPAILACTVGFLVLAPELVLLITKLSRPKSAVRADRSSLLRLWATILTSIALAAPFGYFQAPEAFRFELGAVGIAFTFALLAGGVALRWWAIHTLGKFFTVDVAVHKEHRLITAGPYAWIRHPSYTGLLMELLALALTFQHVFSVGIIMIPTMTALLWRIVVEERALGTRLGELYQTYQSRSYCLVPYVSFRRRFATIAAAEHRDVIPIGAHRPYPTRLRVVPAETLVESRPDLRLPPLPPLPQRDSHVA
jgi:protein-S-isoprenylcysteine O-methyltransferase